MSRRAAAPPCHRTAAPSSRAPSSRSPSSRKATRTLTHSSLSAFARCRRLYQWRYVHGIRRTYQTDALRFGSIWASSCEVIGRTGDLEQALQHAIGCYADIPVWSTPTDREIEQEQLCRLLCGWHYFWIDDGLQVVEVESEFSIPIRNPATGWAAHGWRFRGKRDAIVRQDLPLLVFEQKTTSQGLEAHGNYIRKLRIDSQTSRYLIASGPEVTGIIYDVAKKPTIRPRNVSKADQKRIEESGQYCGEPAEPVSRETVQMYGARLAQDILSNPSKYFVRLEIVRLLHQLDEFRQDLYGLQQEVFQAEKCNRWPRNTDACLQPGKCSYFDLCCNGEKPEDFPNHPPEGYAKAEKIHSELESD